MRKGISPLIAAVLLIAFTMAVAGLAGPFLTQVTQDAQGDTINRSQNLVDSTDVSLEVMSTSYNSSNSSYSVTIRNAGTSSVSDFTATIYGDSPNQKQINKKLEAGEVHTFDISEAGNSTKIEIEARDQPIKTDAELNKEDSSGSTSKVQTIESFEGRDISTEYSGATSSYSVKTDSSKAFDGDDYLYSDMSNSNEGIYIQDPPGGSLSRGDTLNVSIYPMATDIRPGVGFFYDGTNWYRANVEYADNTLNFVKGSPGSDNGVTSTSLSSTPTNEWITLEIKTYSANDDIDITVYDADGNQLASITSTDGDYTGTGIGFAANSVSGGDQRWDYVIKE